MGSIAFTIALVIITVILSIAALSDSRLATSLILWPARMHRAKEYYRLLTAGFIHVNGFHLALNMLTLVLIGSSVERAFIAHHINPWLYVLLYLSGIIVAALPSFFKHRNDLYYQALGASGGVAGVLFSSVYFSPWNGVLVFGFPMKNILFAGLYLLYSMYMSRRGSTRIGHDAHFWGAIWGFLFTLAVDPSHGQTFWDQMLRIF